MWFILALITIVSWGGSDLFSKMGSRSDDRHSHWKIVMAVGTVMGIHATVEILTGAEFYPADFLKYSPAIIFYISSMILGYVGLRYLMLSVSSPICNSSGAVACILCLIFLGQNPDPLTWVGIVLVVAGVIGLAFAEKAHLGQQMGTIGGILAYATYKIKDKSTTLKGYGREKTSDLPCNVAEKLRPNFPYASGTVCWLPRRRKCFLYVFSTSY